MQVEFELSQTLISPDGQGIRSGAVLPRRRNKHNNDNDTPKDPDTTQEMITEENIHVDELYRIVLGNQAGRLDEFSIPSGLLLLPTLDDNNEPTNASSATSRTSGMTYQHDHAVTSMISNETFYVTGCKDSCVRLFSSIDHTLLATLKGHEKPVTSLAWVPVATEVSSSSKYFLVSGSWDGTAKVWEVQYEKSSNSMSNKLVGTLPGHENSVCVTGLQNANGGSNVLCVATGSAGVAQGNQIVNHTVRIWHVDSTMQTPPRIVHQISNEHDGPIRDIVASVMRGSSSSSFPLVATCSNDGTVKLRSPNSGACTDTLMLLGTSAMTDQQHPPMLLSARFIGDNESDGDACGNVVLVVSAEDGHVAVWTKDSSSQDFLHPPQIILHPQTVWNIVPLPNGDFGTCCQDGTFRIFTRCTDRMASLSEREAFQVDVQKTIQAQQGGPTSEEISKLPLWENNYNHRGTSEGQVHLFQKNGIAIAAQWSVASQTWIEVGQVMGRPGGGSSSDDSDNIIDGIRYDYAFPIEVDGAGGTVVSLRIGYNTGENQFVAAQRFIDTHGLPQYHLSQIADYLQQRVGTSTPTLGTSGVSSSSSRPNAATTGVPISSYQYIPAKAYKQLDLPKKNAVTTLEKMQSKIIEVQLILDNEKKLLETIISSLKGRMQNTSFTNITEEEVQLLANILTRSSLSHFDVIFPILDLARLMILQHDATVTTKKVTLWRDQIIPQVIELCKKSINRQQQQQQNQPTPAAGSGTTTPPEIAISMLSLRLFANAFTAPAAASDKVIITGDHLDSIVTCIELHVQSSNKSIRASVATTLHNVCFFIHSLSLKSNAHEGGSNMMLILVVPKIVAAINTILEETKFAYEAEPMHQVLIGLGTLIMSNDTARTIAKTMYYMTSKVEPAASRTNNDAVKTTAKEVYSLLA